MLQHVASASNLNEFSICRPYPIGIVVIVCIMCAYETSIVLKLRPMYSSAHKHRHTVWQMESKQTSKTTQTHNLLNKRFMLYCTTCSRVYFQILYRPAGTETWHEPYFPNDQRQRREISSQQYNQCVREQEIAAASIRHTPNKKTEQKKQEVQIDYIVRFSERCDRWWYII